MISGLGCDLIEVSRIEEQLKTDPGLFAKIFTQTEIEFCDSQRYPAPHYAARFAAKEALFKALGTGLQPGMSWLDAEIRRDLSGAPSFYLTGAAAELVATRGIRQILVSLSHTEHYGTATVLLES